MNIQEFVNHYSDSEPGNPLEDAGPFSMRLASIIRDRERARSLLAMNYLNAFMNSSAIFPTLKRLEIEFGSLERSSWIVVPRPHLNRFDLLLLDPGPITGPTRSALAKPTQDQIIDGWNVWAALSASRLPTMSLLNAAMADEQVVRDQPFALVWAAAPSVELTGPPSSALEVDPGASGWRSTAGLVATDIHGRTGVTAALHAVQAASTAQVDGQSGTVVASDLVSDSCFIELTQAPTTGSNGAKGALMNTLPRGNQAAQFDGCTSHQTNTTIIGWDLAIPNVALYNQLRVYTCKDTDQGDSGSALISDDDYIVGFAFERTGYGKIPEYSSWIWAHSVIHALKLV